MHLVLLTEDVHWKDKGDILQHQEKIKKSNTCENLVDGIVPHILACKNSHGDDISRTSKQADSKADIAMEGSVDML